MQQNMKAMKLSEWSMGEGRPPDDVREQAIRNIAHEDASETSRR